MVAVILFEQEKRRALFEHAMKGNDQEIIASVKTPIELLSATAKLAPDLLLIDVRSPGKEILRTIAEIIRLKPLPVVLFSDDVNHDTIESASNAGVSSHVINCTNLERIRSITEVTLERFKKTQAIQSELEKTKNTLADRRDIDIAKGIIMQRRQLTENEAYHSLRKHAMNKNISVGEAARSIIGAAEVLV